MIELISIHIGKTAGSSFLEILKKQYGENQIYHYIDRRSPNSKLQDYIQQIRRKLVLNNLSKNIKVVHGHFYYKHVNKRKA